MKEKKSPEKEQTDIDQLTKRLVKLFFKDFLDFFYPELVKIINFNSIDFIDKELYSDQIEGEETISDILAKVQLTDGKEEMVLIHLEIQSTKDTDIPKRMYRYFSNIWMEYELPVFAFALFIDEAKWRKPISNVFKVEFMGTKLTYEYELKKTKNYYYRDYMDHENPITAALMTRMDFGKDSRALAKAEALKKVEKYNLTELQKETIINFIDKLLYLKPKEKKEFKKIIKQEQYKEVHIMMTSWQEEALEKGLKKGLEKGKEEERLQIARKALEKGLEIKIIAEITGLTLEIIKNLKEEFLKK